MKASTLFIVCLSLVSVGSYAQERESSVNSGSYKRGTAKQTTTSTSTWDEKAGYQADERRLPDASKRTAKDASKGAHNSTVEKFEGESSADKRK